MTNLGIIIGVEEYKNFNNLKACSNDADIINSILVSTNKYDDFLYINGEVDSNDLRDKIIEFIQKHKEKEIDELFFYFSGHGHSDENDFYFITSNTSREQINSSSLQNQDLDKYLRELNPKLFVKFIDACNSGVQYIKGTENTCDIPSVSSDEIFKKSIEDKFKSCYFMNSSQYQQFSYASSKISEFTESFIRSIINSKPNSTLRYKQILDSISDYFINNKRQKPFFITQGSLVEEFCIVTEQMIDTLKKYVDIKKSNSSDVVLSATENNLMDKIENAIKASASQEETKAVIDKIKEEINLYKVSDQTLSRYYSVVSNGISDHYYLPNKINISRWIRDNRSALKLFATPVYEKNQKPLTFFESKEVVGYRNNVSELPFGDEITLVSNQEAGPKFSVTFTYIYSLQSIYLFYCFSSLYPENWERYKTASSSDWNFIKVNTKSSSDESIKTSFRDIVSDFEDYVTSGLDSYFS